MTHPHVLHATTALWSLRRSWPQLERAQKAAEAAAAETQDHGTLQAWRPGSGHSGGPHDPLLAAVLDPPESRTVAWLADLAERVRQHAEQARWLALSNLRRQPDGNSLLGQIHTALSHVDPLTARDIAQELGAADRAIRRALRIPPQEWPIWTPACPVCGLRQLHVQTAAPDSSEWTVICRGGCRCLGDGCPCGMPIRERGVVHIWDRDSDLVAQRLMSALAA